MSLVGIGEFARLSRLSPKALRLYDELGLLVPAEVDAETGYRWYADTQLERARLVASLRRIRVPLARIRDMLALDPATAETEAPTTMPSMPVSVRMRRDAHDDAFAAVSVRIHRDGSEGPAARHDRAAAATTPKNAETAGERRARPSC